VFSLAPCGERGTAEYRTPDEPPPEYLSGVLPCYPLVALLKSGYASSYPYSPKCVEIEFSEVPHSPGPILGVSYVHSQVLYIRVR